MKKLMMGVLVLLLTQSVSAQQEAKSKKQIRREQREEKMNKMARQEEEGVIGYSRHLVFGFKLTTDGYGGLVEIARAQSVKRATLYQLEITERKTAKEEKLQNPYFNTTPFILGKINFVYPVKLGLQKQFLLGNKGNKNGVSITGNIGGGIAMSLLRPYQVEVADTTTGGTKFVSYESDSSTYFTHQIVSGPGFGRGWGQVKVVPGAYVKSGVRFDYGKYNEMVSAIEVGLSAEFYSKKIPQMIYQKYQQFFFSGYVAIVFGKRK